MIESKRRKGWRRGVPPLVWKNDPRGVMVATDPFRQLRRTPWEGEFGAQDTALLVIDLQYFDAHPDWGEGLTARQKGVEQLFAPMFSGVRRILPEVARLLKAARSRNVEIIHVRVAELTADSRDVGRKQRVRGLFVSRDSKEAEFLPEVAPLGDELIISKSSSGVFPWTNLDMVFRAMGMRHLVLTGISTGGCVESAVRDAADMGYLVTVVEDACADSSPSSHEAALDRIVGGRVRRATSEDVLEEIEAFEDRVIPENIPPPGSDSWSPEDPYSAIFGTAVEPAIEPGRTALLLLNCQRFGADPEGGLARRARAAGAGSELDEYFARAVPAIQGIADLVNACRGAGIPLIHLPQGEVVPGGGDASPDRLARGFSFDRTGDDARYLSGLEPAAGEPVLWRNAAGAFNGSGLDWTLRHMGVEEVVVAGISYDGSVESTMRSASDRGYGVILAAEACLETTSEAQDRLAKLTSGLVSALPVQSILRRLNDRKS